MLARPTRCLGPVLLLLFASQAQADDSPPVPSDPVFQAIRTDGTTAKGQIRQLGPKDQIVLSDAGAEVAIPLGQLVKLTREGDPPASPATGQVILFPGGDRLRARVGNSTETALELQPPALDPRLASPFDAPLSVSLDSLLAVLLAPAADHPAQEALLFRLRDDPRKSEVLRTTNDDRIEGGFLGLGPVAVKFERENGPPEIDRARVSAIEFDPKLATYPEPKGPWLELTFLDGSRLGAKSTRIEDGRVVFETRFGATLRAPIGSLAEVRTQGGPIVNLADREPDASDYIGYLGGHRGTHGRDRTADGRTMRLGGRPFDRGIGAEPRTLLAYRLKPGDQKFQATVGLDDRAGSRGSVVFRVMVDGKEKFASPSMTPRDAPRTIDVDLKGARILVLITEFGEGGDVQDLADWAEARIIRGN